MSSSAERTLVKFDVSMPWMLMSGSSSSDFWSKKGLSKSQPAAPSTVQRLTKFNWVPQWKSILRTCHKEVKGILCFQASPISWNRQVYDCLYPSYFALILFSSSFASKQFWMFIDVATPEIWDFYLRLDHLLVPHLWQLSHTDDHTPRACWTPCLSTTQVPMKTTPSLMQRTTLSKIIGFMSTVYPKP